MMAIEKMFSNLQLQTMISLCMHNGNKYPQPGTSTIYLISRVEKCIERSKLLACAQPLYHYVEPLYRFYIGTSNRIVTSISNWLTTDMETAMFTLKHTWAGLHSNYRLEDLLVQKWTVPSL